VDEGLAAQASRRDFAAVSADDPTGYGIVDTNSGNESADDLPEFLITQKAGAGPAQHAVCFLQIRHATLLSNAKSQVVIRLRGSSTDEKQTSVFQIGTVSCHLHHPLSRSVEDKR
jgi:hypothetical protein